MFAKTIFAAALVLGTSLTFVANASAEPWQGGRNGESHYVQASMLPYYRAGNSPLCPLDHSYRSCFYPG